MFWSENLGEFVMLLVDGAMEPRVRLLSLQCPLDLLDLQVLICVGSLGERSISASIPELCQPMQLDEPGRERGNLSTEPWHAPIFRGL